MINDEATKIAIGIATDLISDIFKESYSVIKSWISKEIKTTDFFGIAAKKYSEKVIARHNSIKILGMRDSIPLRKLYVRVNLLEKISSRQSVNLFEIQRFFNWDTRDFGNVIETLLSCPKKCPHIN